MKTSWRDFSKILGGIVFFGVLAYNLYAGAAIANAVFRAVVTLLLVSIINIIATHVIARVLNEYEYRRLQELNAEEERAEMEEDEARREAEEAEMEEAKEDKKARRGRPESEEGEGAEGTS